MVKYILIVATTSLVYLIGYFHGRRNGRKAEYKAWQQEVVPEMEKLKNERNALWRSAVQKTQKLNHLAKNFKPYI
jgi:hypothetical protein